MDSCLGTSMAAAVLVHHQVLLVLCMECCGISCQPADVPSSCRCQCDVREGVCHHLRPTYAISLTADDMSFFGCCGMLGSQAMRGDIMVTLNVLWNVVLWNVDVWGQSERK